MNRVAVVRFLAAHHWVASTEQLRALGVTKAALQHARRTGVLTSPAPGVVQVAGTTLEFEGRALLAQLAARREAFVSGPSAGVLYGLREMPKRFVEITIKHQRRVTLPPDVRLVRTSWIVEDRDVVSRPDGLRVASPLRTLFGLAGQFTQHRFERAAEDAWHHRLVSPDDAREYLEVIRRSGRGGVRRMDRWLEQTSARTRPSQSGLEMDFVRLIEQAGLPTPERQFALMLTSGETIHLDLAWPAVRLAVEPSHSWWHGGDLGQQRDHARDRASAAVGWLVIRWNEHARRTPGETVRELVSIYRRRAGDLQSRESGDH